MKAFAINITWNTTRENTFNLSLHEFNGEILCLSEWAERLNVSPESLIWRLKRWTNKEDVFTKKRGVTGPLNKEHTMRNVQLECMECNTKKGVKNGGQQRLF